MFLRCVGFASVVICMGLTADLRAQKGGKVKQVDKPGTATFRCNGPTAATHPAGMPCGPVVAGFVPAYPDAITGDGSAYIGVGVTVGGSGAFLRYDGEFDLIVRPTDGRTVYLNFESVLSPPTGRKNFNYADLPGLAFNTNVIDPRTNDVAGNGLLSIPVAQTWPT